MKNKRSILVAAALIAVLLISGVVIYAQQGSSFTDKRINGDINLGGLAIYCVDQFGEPGAPELDNGGITIWGVGGRKYVELSEAQLRGQQTSAARLPLLLAQADATNGRLWLFRTGEDQFVLQSTDTTGKFFTYQWTGCSIGSISTGGGPLIAAQPTTMPTNTVSGSSLGGLIGGGTASTAQPTQVATQASTTQPTEAATTEPTTGG